ncbi:MAG: NUDIX hydrolase [Acidimicrobiia bacterium]|nr:NUDIX hydrolase [Acidimicrobiia bacterium]
MSVPAVDPLRETLIERRHIHAGRLLQVVDDEVRLEDGRVTHREVVQHPGAVCIVAVDDGGRVALVRQWRHPVGHALWELPAGTRDHAGEAPVDTAKRELAEEVGVAAASWRSLAEWPLAPGYSSEAMHFYLVREISDGTAAADADEQLEVGWFTREAISGLLRGGAVDVKTVAGLAIAGFDVTLHG